MSVTKILQGYLSMTADAVMIGLRGVEDDEATICYANASFSRLFGHPQEELIGQQTRMIHPADVWDDLRQAIQPHFDAGDQSFFAETECIRLDGTRFWTSISFFVIHDEEARCRYVCATYRDIEDLKKRELAAAEALQDRMNLLVQQQQMYDELLATQTRLMSAINAYPEPFVIYDEDKRLVTCNTAYQRAMSDDPARIKPGMLLSEVLDEALDCGLIPPAEGSRKDFFEELYRRHEQELPEDIELPGDKHHRIFRSRAPNGDWVIVRMDITETVREKRQSTELQTRMVEAMNAYPDPFAIFDKDDRLLLWNEAFVDLISDDPAAVSTGMSARACIGKGLETGKIDQTYARSAEQMLDRDFSTEADDSTHRDVELRDGRHFRILRSRAANGDQVVIHQNTTQLVNQTSRAQDARQRLLSAIGAYPAPFCIFDADAKLVVWNDSYTEWLTDDPSMIRVGMSKAEILALAAHSGRFPDAAGREDIWIKDMLESFQKGDSFQDISLSGDAYFRELRSRSANGDTVIVRLDTTELVRQSRTLQETRDRLVSALNAFPDPFAIYDRGLHLVLWNEAFEAELDSCGKLDLEHMHISDVLRLMLASRGIPEADGDQEAWIENYVRTRATKNAKEEIEVGDDKHYRITRSIAENGDVLAMRLDITEIVRQRRDLQRYATELENANQKMKYEALHDQLTGLGNRRYLRAKFEEFSRIRAEQGGELAALHIDLDHFKQINDTIGHAAGDHVLKDVALRIRGNLRASDIVARIGGDEFVVLLWVPQVNDFPEMLAASLIHDLSVPSIFEGRECRFGCSIGIAKTPLAEEGDLLTNSDVALYNAKRAGRGRAAVFNQCDIEEMRDTKALADDIMRGLADQEFEPFYQPQVDTRTGAVVGVEALARWRHPDRGILAPGAFLRVAGEMNALADIDRMIFEKALQQFEASFGESGIRPNLSFNISARRLEHDAMIDIGQMVRKYSGDVAFELLETIFLEEESDAFLMRLDQLRELGIGIEVDDFGSGRASIVALQRIAPDRLKIDQRLVAPMREGNRATQLVKSIIDIGHALDISVIAEGVETDEQVRLLTELGAERLQGYGFAPPLAIGDLLDYLDKREAKRRTG